MSRRNNKLPKPSAPLATLNVEQFRAVIRDELQRGQQVRLGLAQVERLSLSQAREVSKSRTQTVQKALRSGALVGSKDGRDWSIARDDLMRWIEAGRPMGEDQAAEPEPAANA